MEEGIGKIRMAMEEMDRMRIQLWNMGVSKWKYNEKVKKVEVVNKEGIRFKAMKAYREAQIETS